MQRENGFDAAHSAGLFIGVNQFTIDRNLAPIPFAVDDAVDLAWTFSAELNLIRFEQIVLCLGGAPRKPETAERLERLREAGATCHGGSRTEIGLALVEFADLARPEGLMVASVSTHGFEVGGAHYFLATDSARRIAAESAIPVSSLKRELLRPAGVRRRLLLVDTCRERLDTGEAKRVGGGLNPSLAAELGKAEGFASLFATVAEGYSYDDPVAGNGVFTAGVLRGLRGEAPTDDGGFLRVGALANYVDQHVRGWIRANNPHVGHPPGITRNLESDGEQLPLAFDETKWSARREEERLAAERAAEDARLRAEATARAKAEEEARRAAAEAERRAAEAAVTERIRLARQRISAAAAVDDAVADRLGAITAALRDWPADRRHRLLTEIEAMDPDNPRLRHYFTEVAWKQLAPEWSPAPSSSSTAAPKMVEVKPPEPPRVVYTPPPSPPPAPPAAPSPPDPTANSSITSQGTKAGDRAELTLLGGVKMAMRWIPAGSFGMGEETSPVQVRLSRGFWMAETEVTQVHWRAIMRTDPSEFKGDTLPVEKVSWNDAVEFCQTLSGSTGMKVALPTEAQWEYACRAGTTTRFYSGSSDGDLGSVGWYASNSGNKTNPIGQKAENAWGLRDMHGNVWEWCSDWYDWSLPGGMDPTGASASSYRVVRGGSWGDGAQYCRSAYRSYDGPARRINYIGFRPVILVL